jgi:CheY-like chemotaxis protein
MLRKRLVLIADDNRELRETLASVLAGDGYQTKTAGDGAEAASLAAAIDPDVVVMDLVMPVMDGLEATRRIRADARTALLPVIALTALETAAMRRRAYAAGCTAFVVKPVEPEDLIAVIEEVIEARGRPALDDRSSSD